jgi:hypothetical protein
MHIFRTLSEVREQTEYWLANTINKFRTTARAG